MFKDNSRLYIIITVVISVFILITALVMINRSVKEDLSKSTCNTLEEILEQQSHNFSSTLTAEMEMIQSIASLIATSKDVKDIPVSSLTDLADNISFQYLTVSDLEGNAFNSIRDDISVSNYTFFYEAKSGRTIITDPFISSVRNLNIIAIATPIYYKEDIIGVLFGSYTADTLSNLFISSFDGKGYAFITTNSGDIIAHTENDFTLTSTENLFTDWERMNFYANDSFNTMRLNIAQNIPGHSKYEIDGQKRLMHYATIAINDWNIFSVVPDDVISEKANNILLTVYLLTFLMVTLTLILVAIMVYMQRKHLRQITDIAFFDELTGAPSLLKFKIDAQRLIEENPNSKYLLVKNDIDRFKLINQFFGFAEGDKVLKSMALAMKASIASDNETYAKINIDEFLLLHEYINEEHLFSRRQVFLDTFHELMGDSFDFSINFPSGHYYMNFDDCYTISEAIEKANVAHKKAKKTGVEVCIYDEEFINAEIERKNIENKMEAALSNNEFKMFLQGKRYLSDESLAGAEALARWWINGRFIMYPSDFVPVFEKNGFIIKLDMFMFEEACKFISNLILKGQNPLVISVNFSRLHLYNANFVSELCGLTDKYHIPRKYLEIEITETAILDNEDLFNKVLTELHQKGFTLSMDDFGTGYSSLGLLKNIDFDVIKIDRSFFTNSINPEKTRHVLSNVIKMAKDLKIHTVAEGVEEKEQIIMLKELDCDIVQGYYYAKPIPFEEFEKEHYIT